MESKIKQLKQRNIIIAVIMLIIIITILIIYHIYNILYESTWHDDLARTTTEDKKYIDELYRTYEEEKVEKIVVLELLNNVRTQNEKYEEVMGKVQIQYNGTIYNDVEDVRTQIKEHKEILYYSVTVLDNKASNYGVDQINIDDYIEDTN